MLPQVFVAACGLSLVAAEWGPSPVVVHRLLIAVVSLVALWCCGPRGLWDVSSRTWDLTCVPLIGRRILNHWATRGVQTRGILDIYFVKGHMLPQGLFSFF